MCHALLFERGERLLPPVPQLSIIHNLLSSPNSEFESNQPASVNQINAEPEVIIIDSLIETIILTSDSDEIAESNEIIIERDLTERLFTENFTNFHLLTLF